MTVSTYVQNHTTITQPTPNKNNAACNTCYTLHSLLPHFMSLPQTTHHDCSCRSQAPIQHPLVYSTHSVSSQYWRMLLSCSSSRALMAVTAASNMLPWASAHNIAWQQCDASMHAYIGHTVYMYMYTTHNLLYTTHNVLYVHVCTMYQYINCICCVEHAYYVCRAEKQF